MVSVQPRRQAGPSTAKRRVLERRHAVPALSRQCSGTASDDVVPTLRITGYRSKNPADVSCRTRGHRHELPLIISGSTFRSRLWVEDFCGGDAGVFDRDLARDAAALLGDGIGLHHFQPAGWGNVVQ